MDRQRRFNKKGKGKKAFRTTNLNRVTDDQGNIIGYQSVTTQSRRKDKGKSYKEKTLTPVFDAAGNQVGFERNVTRYRNVNQSRKDKARGRGVEYAPGDEKGAEYVVTRSRTRLRGDAKDLPKTSRMNTSIGARARAYGATGGYGGGSYTPKKEGMTIKEAFFSMKPGDSVDESAPLAATGMGRYSRSRRSLAKKGVEDFNANRRLAAHLRPEGTLRRSRKMERKLKRGTTNINPYAGSYRGARFNPDAGFKGMVNLQGGPVSTEGNAYQYSRTTGIYGVR